MTTWEEWWSELGTASSTAVRGGLVSVRDYVRSARPPEEVAIMEKAAHYEADAVFFEAPHNDKPPIAQAISADHWPSLPKPRREKPYLGLLKCSECGGAITAELQKGHIYYRCTKKSKNLKCSQPYVREQQLDGEIASILSPYSLRPAAAEEMLAKLDDEERQSQSAIKANIEKVRTEIDELRRNLDMLLDMALKGEITRDMFTSKKLTLLGEKRLFEEEINTLSRGRLPWLEPMRDWVLTAKHVGEIAKTGTPKERRLLASKIFGSNLMLERKKARGEAVNPWPLIAATSRGDTLVHLYDSARTFFQKNAGRTWQG